jgi:DNA-binding transcriptional LysR family regulator
MLFICVMHDVHDASLAGIDLNLLVVLDALLTERHVTRAARRIGLTQPAASHALARLRALLDDPVLVRGPGGGLVPTARAEAIAPALRTALDGIAAALRGTPGFEPATARRTFRIATNDHAELVLLPRLVARLAVEAPCVDLWVVQTPEDPGAALAAGAIDGAIGVWRGRAWPAGIYERRLFDDDFRCVVRRGHPAAAQRLTLTRFCALSHLLVAPRGTRGGLVDDALAAQGKRRRIAIAVPHFLVAPHVIAETDLIVTLAARVARVFAEPLGLVLLPPPVELRRFTTSLVWHERVHHDPGQRWLRELCQSVGSGAIGGTTAR